MKTPKIDMITTVKWVGMGISALGGVMTAWAGAEESKRAIKEGIENITKEVLKK